MTHKMHNAIYAAIDTLAQAEKITRKVLAELSRDLLIYVPESNDIEAVNRLMNVLTPMNKQAARLYFQHFLPWQAENDTDGVFQRFGKKLQGEKKTQKKLDAIVLWLADESNNIWTWADQNIELKQKDFKATVARAIAKALEGDEKTDTPPLDRATLMEAIFEGGVTLEDMLAAIDTKEAQYAAAMQGEGQEEYEPAH